MNIFDRRATARRNGDEYLRSARERRAEAVRSIYDRNGDEYSRSARERRSETVMREPGNTSGRARECVWESQGVEKRREEKRRE